MLGGPLLLLLVFIFFMPILFSLFFASYGCTVRPPLVCALGYLHLKEKRSLEQKDSAEGIRIYHAESGTQEVGFRGGS